MKKLKVMTIVGTRPEIIRLSRIITKLDQHCDHILVHTGQNFDYESLNEIKWIDVPVIPNTLIINIGDIMQRWTNDTWKSTLHQVINIKCSSERRQSIAFFHNPNKDAIIESIITDNKSK